MAVAWLAAAGGRARAQPAPPQPQPSQAGARPSPPQPAPAQPPYRQPSPKPLKRLRMVILGVTPLGRIGADGKPSGMFVDLGALLAAEAGIPIDVVVVPYPRAMAMMAAGEADLICSLPNSRLEQLATPLALVMKGEVIVLGRAGTRYTSLADLRGKVVGHLRSAEYGTPFEADTAIRKHETISSAQTMAMLLEGRYDAVIGLGPVLFYALRELGQPRAKLGPSLHLWPRDVSLYMSLNSSQPQTAEALARALDRLRNSGRLKAMMDTYLAGLPRD